MFIQIDNSLNQNVVRSRLNKSLGNLNEEFHLSNLNHRNSFVSKLLPSSSFRNPNVREIVVVNPGRMSNKSSRSLMELRKGSYQNDGNLIGLKDLKHISTFEPFSVSISRKRNNDSTRSTNSMMVVDTSSNSIKPKCFVPELNKFGCDEVIYLFLNIFWVYFVICIF